MGARKTMLNKATGRRVFVTGAIGQKLRKQQKAKPVNKKPVKKHVKPAKKLAQKTVKKTYKKFATPSTPKNKCAGFQCGFKCAPGAPRKKSGPFAGNNYGYEGATKKPSQLIKTHGKTVFKRPSARALFDEGYRGTVTYAGKTWRMAQRKSNGSPYWEPM